MTVQSQFQIFSDKYLPRVWGPIMLCSRYKSKVPLLCPSSRSIEGRHLKKFQRRHKKISNSIKKLPLNAADSVNIVFHFCLLWHWIRHKMYHKCCYSLTVAVESHPSMSRNMKETVQGCISCGILVSGIWARGVSSEHMENMEMFSCSLT